MNEELIHFTRRALARNIPRPEIAGALAKAGWGTSDISQALASFAEVEFPVPVPWPKPYLSAREVFIYLVMFGALYDSCYQVGSIIFDLINRAFPDPSQNTGYFSLYYNDAIRWSVAQLIVSFPLFFFTFRSINAGIVTNPARRNSKARKWLTYLTLLIATVSLTCDIGTLLYNVLGGELTVRFLLKVLTVAVIAGGNFLYFLADMRREEKE